MGGHFFQGGQDAVHVVVGIDENNDHGELAAGLDQVGGFHAVAAEESGDGVNGGGGVDIFLAQVVENLQMKRAVAPLVGFCGSFTTFSSYAFETMAYFEQGQWGLMLANILTNNILCLGAALAGMAVARVL